MDWTGLQPRQLPFARTFFAKAVRGHMSEGVRGNISHRLRRLCLLPVSRAGILGQTVRAHAAGISVCVQGPRTDHLQNVPVAPALRPASRQGKRRIPECRNAERNVSVTGELYFEVAKDKSRPFHVTVKSGSAHQKDMEIEVLGTHFNINAYEDESSIRTTLFEGSVKVALGEENSLLKPGQQSVINSTREITGQQKKSAAITIIKDVNLEEVIAWKDGYFQFKRADIQTVMRQIARWYDVEVVYEGAIPKDRFVGDLPMDANISQVLRTLEKVQVHFRIEGKKIIVTP